MGRETGLLQNLLLSSFVRVIFMIYGLWQDSFMLVKYTDVDYYVFTDAAEFVTKGLSPYQRATYRYTPLLAWLLTCNVYISPHLGKILFILCDVIVGYLIYKILCVRRESHSTALFCCQLWLYNPLAIAVSTRGNAESILAALVLATIYCLLYTGLGYVLVAAVLYALSVHMKIYPVTYCLAVYFFLGNQLPSCTLLSGDLGKWLRVYLWPRRDRLIYVIIVILVFSLLTGYCYVLYGDEFLHETYLYHVTRKDTRHNFSPYFYMLYLTTDTPHAGLLGLLAFLPQVSLLTLVSFKFHQDLPFCCFLLTFIFVSFNKVCTSQYFLWYLSLLPLIIPQLHMSWKRAVVLIALWFVGQGLWLTPAYYLEFEGRNTFLLIWTAGLVFFLINIWIIYDVIKYYRFTPISVKQRPVRNFPTMEEYLAGLWRSLRREHCQAIKGD